MILLGEYHESELYWVFEHTMYDGYTIEGLCRVLKDKDRKLRQAVMCSDKMNELRYRVYELSLWEKVIASTDRALFELLVSHESTYEWHTAWFPFFPKMDWTVDAYFILTSKYGWRPEYE